MRTYTFVLLLYWLLYFAVDKVLLDDQVYYDSLIEQFTYDKITTLLDEGKKWKWLTAALLPFILFFKISFTAGCLFTGNFFSESRHDFSKFFSIAAKAEIIFVIPGVLKLLWFSFFDTNYTIEDVNFFTPFSLTTVFRLTELESWFLYPLSLLNLFEILYWTILAFQLNGIRNSDFTSNLGFVLKTYGAGLSVWIVFVVFLIVSAS